MKIRICIEGTSPLLMKKFTDQDAMASSGGSRGSSAAADRGTPQEIAESRIYRDLNGNVCIPQPNLLRCLVDGGTFHKIGRRQVTTKESSQLYGCVDIAEATITLLHQQPWKVHTMAVVIPATKGRILCHRPCFDDWKLDFIVHLDESIINRKLLRLIIDDAGKRVGLGDFRPARKGPYGKFCVTLWQELEG